MASPELCIARLLCFAALTATLTSVGCSRNNPLFDQGTGTGGDADDDGDSPDADGPDGDGPDGDGSDGGDQDSVSDADGGATGPDPLGCERNQICYEQPEDGWSGPVALTLSDTDRGEANSCRDAAFPEGIRRSPADGLSPPSVDCCECSTTDATCAAELVSFPDSFCEDAAVPLVGDATECTVPATLEENVHYGIVFWPTNDGICSALQPVDPVFDAVPDAIGELCGGAEKLGPCDGGDCYARPSARSDALLCIYQDASDAQCPDPWTEAHALFDFTTDAYSCPACACGKLETPSCNPTLNSYGKANCGGLPTDEGALLWCVQGMSIPYLSFDVSFDVSTPGCDQLSEDGPVGDPDFHNETTVCCLPG